MATITNVQREQHLKNGKRLEEIAEYLWFTVYGRAKRHAERRLFNATEGGRLRWIVIFSKCGYSYEF
jgi:hypothetical protein